jgi:hypothetical protein
MKANSTSKPNVIARLTITRANGWKTIVTVEADASFSSFYKYFKQFGLKRSTKEPIRVANRNEGLSYINAHLQTPGLDLIEKRLAAYQSQSNPIVSTKLRIIKKRAYKKLLGARPDELGMVKISSVPIPAPAWRSARAIGMRIPALEAVQP